MNIENTYDEVLFAATVGLEPDEKDIAAVRVPPDEDARQFLTDLKATAKEIAEASKQGMKGEARKLAEEAQNAYLEKFAALMPIPAGTDETPVADIGSRMFGNGSAELTDTANRMFGRN